VRTVRIDGEDRPVCCPGCAAVATLIADSGLTGFYRYRSGPAPTPVADDPDEWTAYDRDALQRTFVQQTDNGEREAVLLIEGLYCAACAWLIEHILTPIDGVRAIEVNPATGRALLRWDPERVALSTLLRRMSEVGYRPHPVDEEGTEPLAMRERRAGLRRLGVAGLGMMQVMMYAVGLYAGAIHADMDPAIARLLRLVSLFVATPVVLYAGAPFFRGAWRDLRAGRPGMDVPVSLAIGAAFTASVWNTLIAGGEVYFDSVTMFVFFLSVARFFEMSARHRASRSTGSLARMLPATALRISDGREEHVALRELAVGDRVRVRAGEPVPADGRILSGESRFDESLLTGEFQPVTRAAGAEVIGGSLNTDTPVDVEVTRIGQDTLVASIVRLLDRAQSQRPPIAQTADRVARWFVVGVLTAAAGTAGWWWITAPGEAFGITLAVLVVTCPCALSLATPTALVAATSRLARDGLLITRARALENLARADHVVFDKTGTLTRGVLTVTHTETMDRLGADEARALAAALEVHSEHPIARAFASWHDGREAEQIEVERGLGIEGVVAGHRLRLGRTDWVTGLAGDSGDTGDSETIVALGDTDGLLALFHLADSPRPGTAEAVDAISRLGLSCEIASGDAAGPVAALARDLGIEHWHARQTPADKLARIERLRASGRRVVMVGDGINDAPVLAAADVSVAMGGGSALAGNNADMLLSAQRPGDLAAGIAHARRTLAIIRQNLAWAAAYNVIALPLAAAGFVAPWMAALGMSASSLIVVGNAMRLGRGDTHTSPEPSALSKATVEAV
jgi:Cu2+-exporting ATPase